MMEFIKMTALGAALSYGAVSAYNQPIEKLEAALAKHSGGAARLVTLDGGSSKEALARERVPEARVAHN